MVKKRNDLIEYYVARDLALVPYSARQLELLTGFSFAVWTSKDVTQIELNLTHRRSVYPIGVVWRFAHDYQLYHGVAMYLDGVPTDSRMVAANVRHEWQHYREVAQVFIDGEA